jgi:hypothetical protein
MPIPRLHPHSSPPSLPILGTRSLSPDSALYQARSPTHHRHLVLSIFRTYGAMVYPQIVSTDLDV